MKQNFLIMDFVGVLNPLYVLPIVAVVICALLVYAFGFKASVQPPSFDDIEIEKKPSKKRKPKENSKNKQLNGKVSSNKGNDTSASKKKTEKIVKNETKPQPVKKTPVVVEKKKKPSVTPEASIVDDGNEEGWVHLVPRKMRKGRKKEDIVISNMEVAPTVISTPTVTQIEPVKEKEALKQDKKVVVVAEEKTLDTKLKDIPEPVKQIPKKRPPIKEQEEQPLQVVDTNAMDQHFEHAIDRKRESESSESIDSERIKAHKTQKMPKKKKKKKAEITTESSNISNSEPSPAEEIQPNSISDNVVNSRLTVVNASSDENTSKLSTEPIEAKGSNVVFDELQGLYPDSNQKKKKKARRDH